MLGIQFSKRHLGLPMTIEGAADLRETLGDVILALTEPSQAEIGAAAGRTHTGAPGSRTAK